jgi:hypothetical protein
MANLSVAKYLKIYTQGVIDAVSIHKTLPILRENRKATYIVLEICAANIGLILGLGVLIHNGIGPFTEQFQSSHGSRGISRMIDIARSHSTKHFFFQCLWLVPFCGLCYYFCLQSYQKLADCIQKPVERLAKSPAPPSSENPKARAATLQNTIFALSTWIFASVQAQVLIQHVPSLLEKVSTGMTSSHFSLVGLGFKLLQLGSIVIGLVMLSLHYSAYAFDPKWIASGKAPPERFSLLEKYIFYFAGFGTPFLIINRMTSFLTGFGIFLTLFPFAVILGSTLNYRKPTEEKIGEINVAPLRVLEPAQMLADNALKQVEKLIHQGQEKLHMGGGGPGKVEKIAAKEF